MKKNITKVMGMVLSMAMITGLSACGGSKVEETTFSDAPTTEATTEVVETTEEEVPPMPTEAQYHDYEVFSDGEDHNIVFYIDDETNESYSTSFRSTDMFKGWGVESISFPSTESILQAEPTLLDESIKEDENRINYGWENTAVYDNSSWYPGSFSLFTCYDFFQVWRASTANYTIDYNAPDPTAIFNAYYNFYDKDDYEVIRPNEIEVVDEGNGVIGYKFLVFKPHQWVTKDEAYKAHGYMYVRVDSTKDFVQCIVCGNRYTPAGPSYVKYTMFRSAIYTDFDDISEGEICTN